MEKSKPNSRAKNPRGVASSLIKICYVCQFCDKKYVLERTAKKHFNQKHKKLPIFGNRDVSCTEIEWPDCKKWFTKSTSIITSSPDVRPNEASTEIEVIELDVDESSHNQSSNNGGSLHKSYESSEFKSSIIDLEQTRKLVVTELQSAKSKTSRLAEASGVNKTSLKQSTSNVVPGLNDCVADPCHLQKSRVKHKRRRNRKSDCQNSSDDDGFPNFPNLSKKQHFSAKSLSDKCESANEMSVVERVTSKARKHADDKTVNDALKQESGSPSQDTTVSSVITPHEHSLRVTESQANSSDNKDWKRPTGSMEPRNSSNCKTNNSQSNGHENRYWRDSYLYYNTFQNCKCRICGLQCSGSNDLQNHLRTCRQRYDYRPWYSNHSTDGSSNSQYYSRWGLHQHNTGPRSFDYNYDINYRSSTSRINLYSRTYIGNPNYYQRRVLRGDFDQEKKTEVPKQSSSSPGEQKCVKKEKLEPGLDPNRHYCQTCERSFDQKRKLEQHTKDKHKLTSSSDSVHTAIKKEDEE